MKVLADLEVHSKHARAVSPSMDLLNIALWSDKKGIDLVGTGDFTHPVWLRELKASLKEEDGGIYKLRSKVNGERLKVKFLLTCEVSCIYTHKEKGRRVHIMIYLPSFSEVEKFNERLVKLGANLFSDGRPIVGLSLAQVAEIALEVSEEAIIIPAHVWTPWFGFYGHMSGYESLSEAFGGLEDRIPAVETGLSSDPAMNWKIAELVDKRIVSFGDAHSPQNLGREATVFDIEKLTFEEIRAALWGEKGKIAYTVEFYPEEGKYHYTGHRKCGVVYSPKEARKKGMACPVCGKGLTMGVMSRVESLATEPVETDYNKDEFGVRWIEPSLRTRDSSSRRPYAMLVPLNEIIAEAFDVGTGTKTVEEYYEQMVETFGSEFKILLKTPISDFKGKADPKIIEAIEKVRAGDIVIKPGHDGVFGEVRIWKKEEKERNDKADQESLF